MTIDRKSFEGHTPGPLHLDEEGDITDSKNRTLAMALDATDGDVALWMAAPTLLSELDKKDAEIARLREALHQIILYSGLDTDPAIPATARAELKFLKSLLPKARKKTTRKRKAS